MSKPYRLPYTPEFFDDLRDIYSYIAYHLQEKRPAQNQIGQNKAEIEELRRMPEHCPPVSWEPWHSMGMRSFPVDNYVVYYEIDKENQVVHISRVFYGGRDIEGLVQEGRL